MNRRISHIFYISFVVKLLLAVFVPLSLDEMYYWLWGQFPQWSYFDHPPMVGWIMIIGDLLKPLADGAVRWPFVLLSHITIWFWYCILRPVISERHLLLWLMVALFNPLWGLGGIVATPDIPVVFFWTLAFFLCQRIIVQPSTKNYALFGSSLGLGFLSKYMIVLFPLCLLPWLYKEKLFKYLLNSKALLAIFMGFLFCGPVLYWNYQNEFASLSFQWEHGTQSTKWKWHWFLDYTFSQLLLIFPFFVFLLFKNKKVSSQFFYFSVIPLLFFFVTSFFSRVEANWPIVAYPTIYAVAFLNLSGYEKYAKIVIGLWSGLFCVVVGFIISFYLGLPSSHRIKIFEAEKYRNVLHFAKDKKDVFTNSYQMAGFLSFRLNKLHCKLSEVEGRRDFFNYLPQCRNLKNQFYIITENLSIESMEKQVPEYNILNQKIIDKNFAAYEVQKK